MFLHSRLGVIFLAIGLLAAACGGSAKMTAAQTARYVERHSAPGTRVHCERAVYWDYRCTLRDRFLRPAFFDVNDHEVTDSTYPLHG